MDSTTTGNALGRGVYTVSEAARLTRISSARIRRWLEGYRFRTRRGYGSSPPVWSGDLPRLEDRLALSFLDMIEARYVDAFRRKGVSWKTIRLAHEKGRESFGVFHPFCMADFRTDGRALFVWVAKESPEPALMEFVRDQFVFPSVIKPILCDLDFGRDRLAATWFPLGRKRQVVLDPKRCFGAPIVKVEGVPTKVLAENFSTERSYARVAYWYRVSEPAVRDSVEFESALQGERPA